MEKEQELPPPELAVGGSPSPCSGWGLWGFLGPFPAHLGPFPAHLAFLGAGWEETQPLAQALCTSTPHCCQGSPCSCQDPKSPAELHFQSPAGPWCQPLALNPAALGSSLRTGPALLAHLPHPQRAPAVKELGKIQEGASMANTVSGFL